MGKNLKRRLLKPKYTFVSEKLKASCFSTINRKYAFVREKREKTIVCDIFTQRDVKDLYTSPLPSTLLDVCRLKNVARPRVFSAYFGKRSLVILGIFIDKNAQIGNFCINKMVHFGKILCALILLNQFIFLYQYCEIILFRGVYNYVEFVGNMIH